MCGLASPFHPTTLISSRAEIDLQITIPSYCTNSKVHCLLRHGCKTDTCFHAWLNSCGEESERANAGIQMHPSQLSRPHIKTEMQPSFSEKCWVSRGCAIDICPGSIALASQPPLKSDKRSKCWMVIFYWQGLSVGLGRPRRHGTFWIRKGVQFLVGTKGDEMVLLAELQCNLTFFLCYVQETGSLRFISLTPSTHGQGINIRIQRAFVGTCKSVENMLCWLCLL